MSRVLKKYICFSLCLLPLSSVCADELIAANEGAPSLIQQLASDPTPSASAVSPKLPEAPFSAFTGKIKGKKVRMRLSPDLDGQIIKELSKNDFVSVVGEKGDFYAVEPPSGTKAYVFRSFILDNVVEGNRVNVRLEPTLEAPVIGHLNAGDKVDCTTCSANNKWYEIPPPSSARFYVAKEFVDCIGGPEVKLQMDKRHDSALQLLESSSLLSKAELRKPFEQIDIERISHNYKKIISDYSDFPEFVDQAKEALANLQESYVQKRIAFLESKASSKDEPMLIEEQISLAPEADSKPAIGTVAQVREDATDKMKLWEPIEEALYLSWTHVNDDRSINDYYDSQKDQAITLTGILEAYASPVKNKPGDFILRDKDLPVAYVYSTQVNLQNLVGKKVTIVASPRPNNNFAFPAYFVFKVE